MGRVVYDPHSNDYHIIDGNKIIGSVPAPAVRKYMKENSLLSRLITVLTVATGYLSGGVVYDLFLGKKYPFPEVLKSYWDTTLKVGNSLFEYVTGNPQAFDMVNPHDLAAVAIGIAGAIATYMIGRRVYKKIKPTPEEAVIHYLQKAKD